jgi:hypothetical protein
VLHSPYRYMLELFREDGAPLGRTLVRVDWECALEWTRFAGLRRALLPADAVADDATIEPVWDPQARPYVAGFCITIHATGGAQFTSQIPTTYLRDAARRAGASAVARGLLRSGERFRYLVSAFSGAAVPEPQAAAALFQVELVPSVVPVQPCPLRGLLAAAVPLLPTAPEDAPVFLPRAVLEETAALTRSAGANETGGVLVGHLRQDIALPEIGIEISAQIPAHHTQGSLTRLRFTPETWAAVQLARDLRQRDEIFLGWWHSHSYLKEKCRNCSRRIAGTCTASAGFMSEEDCALHRAVFSGAYMVALVISDSPCAGLTWSLFGWRHGLIGSRGFHLLETRPAPATDVPCRGGEPVHAPQC